MPRVESKSTTKDPASNAVNSSVTLGDGRTGDGKSGGFTHGTDHQAETRAIQDANSKPAPSKK
jgi:hypothetical protein